MLILKETDEHKIQFRIRMNESVYKEIEDYCQWADIRYRDYFIQRACEYIFGHDEDWINHKNKIKNSKNKK